MSNGINKQTDNKIRNENGTYFYKIRNGNSSFSYAIEQKLQKIERDIRSQNENMACAAISAILANYLGTKLTQITDSIWVFTLIFIILYLVLKEVFLLKDNAFYIIKHILSRNTILAEDENQFADSFFRMILSELTYGISLVNRSIALQNDKEKVYLSRIYALQGKYCVYQIIQELSEKLFNSGSEDKQHQLALIIGISNLIYVLEASTELLDKINGLEYDINVQHEQEYIKNKLKIVSEWVPEMTD